MSFSRNCVACRASLKSMLAELGFPTAVAKSMEIRLTVQVELFQGFVGSQSTGQGKRDVLPYSASCRKPVSKRKT